MFVLKNFRYLPFNRILSSAEQLHNGHKSELHYIIKVNQKLEAMVINRSLAQIYNDAVGAIDIKSTPDTISFIITVISNV